MRLARPLLLVLVILSCFLVLTTAAREKENAVPAPHPARQVLLDVIVRDDHGRPVKGLRQEDFRVFENHKEQQIRLFEVHEEDTANPSPIVTLPENTFTNAEAPEGGSINVILLDQATTSIAAQELAGNALIHYFKQKPSAARFAIFTFGGRDVLCLSCDGLRLVQGVTSNRDLLVSALKRMTNPRAPLKRPSLDRHEDTILQPIAQLANVMRDLPGRKQLIWMAGNFDAAPVPIRGLSRKFNGWEQVDPGSYPQMLHLAADRLAAAHIAVYPIDLTGRNKRVESLRFCEVDVLDLSSGLVVDTRLEECNSKGVRLDWMAAQTGGAAFHIHSPDDIQNALEQCVSDGRSYYSISYAPMEEKFNHRIRTIKLEVAGEYQLFYRKQYFADDPTTLFRPESSLSPDTAVLRGPWYGKAPVLVPWVVMRAKASKSSESDEAILEHMRYGAPESTEMTFSAHVTMVGKGHKATVEQMKVLENFEAFRSQRIAGAVLTNYGFRPPTRRKTTLPALLSLEPVFIEHFQIDYVLPNRQLNLSPEPNGKFTARAEIAVLAYDDAGKRLAGNKDEITYTLGAGKVADFTASNYEGHQEIDVPEQAAALRIAVRDQATGNTGSLEIPLSAVRSPHERRRLPVRVVAD